MKLRTLVITTTLLAVIAFMCLEQGALWGSVIAGIVSVGIVIYSLYNGIKRKVEIHRFFQCNYENGQDKNSTSYTRTVSNDPQNVKITLTSLAYLNVRYITISFKGNSSITIKQMSAWNMSLDYASRLFSSTSINGGWNWTYYDPFFRRKGEHIRIGIDYLAEIPFSGQIEIYIACKEKTKHILLPFTVLLMPDKQDS